MHHGRQVDEEQAVSQIPGVCDGTERGRVGSNHAQFMRALWSGSPARQEAAVSPSCGCQSTVNRATVVLATQRVRAAPSNSSLVSVTDGTGQAVSAAYSLRGERSSLRRAGNHQYWADTATFSPHAEASSLKLLNQQIPRPLKLQFL